MRGEAALASYEAALMLNGGLEASRCEEVILGRGFYAGCKRSSRSAHPLDACSESVVLIALTWMSARLTDTVTWPSDPQNVLVGA